MVDFKRGMIRTVWKNLQDERFHVMMNVADKLLTFIYSEPPMEKLTMSCSCLNKWKIFSPSLFQRSSSIFFKIHIFLTLKEKWTNQGTEKQLKNCLRGKEIQAVCLDLKCWPRDIVGSLERVVNFKVNLVSGASMNASALRLQNLRGCGGEGLWRSWS